MPRPPMLNRPKVTYGSTTFSFALPCRPFDPSTTAVGGWGESGAGVPASYVIRRDHALDVTLRFSEAEWIASGGVRAWLIWAQDTAGAFDFWLDQTTGISKSCYLVSPRTGEEVKPTRGDYPGTHELAVRIRSADGTPFNWRYYS